MELVIGPRTKASPFMERAVAAGITKAMVYNHTVLPISTADPQAEYRSLTQTAAVWDVGCQRQVQITGPDAHRLVTYLCARDLRSLSVGMARYTPICDHQGRLINDPIALRIDESTFWLSIADSDIGLWARAVAGERGFDVDVSEPDVWPLGVQGPRSPDIVADVLGDWIRELRFFGFRRHLHEGIDMVVCRSGWSGQDGYELFLIGSADGERLWDLVWEAGQRYGIGVGGPNNTERLESFLLSYGGDTDAETDPDEAGLRRFVSLSDDADVDVNEGHDFIGRSALAARRADGNQRHMMGVVIDGDPPMPLRSPCAVCDTEGRAVGTLRSLTHSPRFGANIGLALLEPASSAPGTTLTVIIDATSRTAVTTTLPFDLSEPPPLP